MSFRGGDRSQCTIDQYKGFKYILLALISLLNLSIQLFIGDEYYNLIIKLLQCLLLRFECQLQHRESFYVRRCGSQGSSDLALDPRG